MSVVRPPYAHERELLIRKARARTPEEYTAVVAQETKDAAQWTCGSMAGNTPVGVTCPDISISIENGTVQIHGVCDACRQDTCAILERRKQLLPQ
jgi:hypothetical protein